MIFLPKIARKLVTDFVKKLHSDELTLDVGCGNSPFRVYFPNPVGYDITRGKGVDIIGDALYLPFRENAFEVVLCTEVLEHLREHFLALEEIRRVLKVAGGLILTTRFLYPIHNKPCDFYRYTKYGLEYLLRHYNVKKCMRNHLF